MNTKQTQSVAPIHGVVMASSGKESAAERRLRLYREEKAKKQAKREENREDRLARLRQQRKAKRAIGIKGDATSTPCKQPKNVFLEVNRNGKIKWHRDPVSSDFVTDANEVVLGPFTDDEAFALWMRIKEDVKSVFPPKKKKVAIEFVEGRNPYNDSGMVLASRCVECGEPMAVGVGCCTTCSGQHGSIGKRKLLGSDDNPWRSLAVRILEDG